MPPHSSSSAPPARHLGAFSRAWRILAVLACLGLLAAGHLMRSEHMFPFGILSQYSSAIDPNSQVREAVLEGVRADGSRLDIDILYSTVDVKRSEVENQLDDFRHHPAKLAALAHAYNAKHPSAQLVELALWEDVHELKDGGPTGVVCREVVARWTSSGAAPGVGLEVAP